MYRPCPTHIRALLLGSLAVVPQVNLHNTAQPPATAAVQTKQPRSSPRKARHYTNLAALSISGLVSAFLSYLQLSPTRTPTRPTPAASPIAPRQVANRQQGISATKGTAFAEHKQEQQQPSKPNGLITSHNETQEEAPTVPQQPQTHKQQLLLAYQMLCTAHARLHTAYHSPSPKKKVVARAEAIGLCNQALRLGQDLQAAWGSDNALAQAIVLKKGRLSPNYTLHSLVADMLKEAKACRKEAGKASTSHYKNNPLPDTLKQAIATLQASPATYQQDAQAWVALLEDITAHLEQAFYAREKHTLAQLLKLRQLRGVAHMLIDSTVLAPYKGEVALQATYKRLEALKEHTSVAIRDIILIPKLTLRLADTMLIQSQDYLQQSHGYPAQSPARHIAKAKAKGLAHIAQTLTKELGLTKQRSLYQHAQHIIKSTQHFGSYNPLAAKIQRPQALQTHMATLQAAPVRHPEQEARLWIEVLSNTLHKAPKAYHSQEPARSSTAAATFKVLGEVCEKLAVQYPQAADLFTQKSKELRSKAAQAESTLAHLYQGTT